MTTAAIRKAVVDRAGERCEYCRLAIWQSIYSAFQIEHVRAKQHRGSDDFDNLSLACQACNCFKGPNQSAYDPVSNLLVPLFNPRKQIWREHFVVVAGEVIGLSDVGRATVDLLRMNELHQVGFRLEMGDDDFNLA